METMIAIIVGAVSFLCLLIDGIMKLKNGIKLIQELRDDGKERERKANESIEIILVCGGKELLLPYAPLRRELTRAEVAGVLGFFAQGRKFNIPGLVAIFVDGSFKAVQLGQADQIRIQTPEEEFAAFSKSAEEAKLIVTKAQAEKTA